ncbi:hypothetical protein GOODEAATRI_001895 [Goodea atripinnis]|uniref:Uncharacterized protein n=1 Tax=Goodea atripinnis TaxID=208336 RepID=A0ABV0P0T5_9TELE
MEVDARLKKAVIPNLQPDTSYDFKITAPEGNMGGLRHRITAKTSPPITIRRPEIDQSRRETEATVTIILPLLETRMPVKYVFQTRFTPETLPAFFSLGDQLDYGGFENRALEPGQEYVFFILAELNSTAGVQMSLCYISILCMTTNPSSLLFSCRLSLCVRMYVASPYTDKVIAPDSDPQPFDAGDGLIWVVGPVLAVVFIICIVIAILLYKK